MSEYWYSRWLFERALAAIYLVAFIVAAKQFVPLLGEHGLEPVGRWVQAVSFSASPSLFYLLPRDNVFRACAWLGSFSRPLKPSTITLLKARRPFVRSSIVAASSYHPRG
jgi:hypothetical protein